MATFNKIKWIVSYPKSGNTWVRMFLNSYMMGGDLNLNSFHQVVWNDIQPGLMQQMSPIPLAKIDEEQQIELSQQLLNLIAHFVYLLIE